MEGSKQLYFSSGRHAAQAAARLIGRVSFLVIPFTLRG